MKTPREAAHETYEYVAGYDGCDLVHDVHTSGCDRIMKLVQLARAEGYTAGVRARNSTGDPVAAYRHTFALLGIDEGIQAQVEIRES